MLSATETQKYLALIQNNHLDDALLLANQLNQKYPDDITTYNMLGDVFFKKDDLNNADLCFKASLSINPQQTNVLLILGKIYDVLGHQNFIVDLYTLKYIFVCKYHESKYSYNCRP